MGRPPGWLLHSGIGALFVCFCVLLTLCAFIRYPDKLSASFLLQTEEVPLAIHAGAGELVEAMLVDDGVAVMAGDTLLRLRGESDWEAIDKLSYWSKNLSYNQDENSHPVLFAVLDNPPPIASYQYPPTIQAAVNELTTVVSGYRSYQQTNGVREEVAAFRQEIGEARRFSSAIQQQVRLQDAELDYERRQTERIQSLAADSLLSESEAEAAGARYLSAQRQREALVSSDIQNGLRVQQLNQEILRRKLTHREQLAEFSRLADRYLMTLRSLLSAYHESYHVVAKTDGILSWNTSVRSGGVITGNEPLGYILPDATNRKVVARMQLPATAQGRIDLGDRVLLELASYPSREYGQLSGELAAIEPIATYSQAADSYFRTATVKLPDSLVTSYGQNVPFQYNLSGTALIVTADRTLLQRIFDKFLNLTRNS